MSTIALEPFGRCIYCDATRYSNEREKLAREHLIPQAINGRLILPEASCGDCEKKINRFERYCGQKIFGPLRYSLGLDTKRPKERPTHLPVEFLIGEEWIEYQVPVKIAPITLILPHYRIPGAFDDRDPAEDFMCKEYIFRPLIDPRINDFAASIGAKSGRTYRAEVEAGKFALLLAKISHGFAMDKLGRNPGFTPVLKDLIRQEPSPYSLAYFVGAGPEIEYHEKRPIHVVQIDSEELVGGGFLVFIRLRLFANLETPTYIIIVGTSLARTGALVTVTP